MPFLGEAWARLGALPVVVLVPWRCALMTPPEVDRARAPAHAADPVEGQPIAVPAAFHVPPAVTSAAVPGPGQLEQMPAGHLPGVAEPPGVPAGSAIAKHEAPPQRVQTAPPSPLPTRTVTLPDQVVVTAIAARQPAFLGCWKRAQRLEGLAPGKVRLHLDIDADGKVIGSRSDTDSPELARCLSVVARHLSFPAPGEPAVVDLPLMLQ